LTIPEGLPANGTQVSVAVDEAFTHLVVEEWLEGVAKAALSVALVSPDAAQMSLLITDDVTVQTLNHRFRGLNEVTDVLSFSTVYPGHWEGDDVGGIELPEGAELPGGIGLQGDDAQDEPVAFDFVMPPGEPDPLGEVIVSYPQMRRQAEARGIPLERELALLIVHGVLHLIGHDHVESEEAAEMQSKEQAALRSLQLVEGQSP
jgi:probable rRNA maturation factor